MRNLEKRDGSYFQSDAVWRSRKSLSRIHDLGQRQNRKKPGKIRLQLSKVSTGPQKQNLQEG